MIRGKLQEKVSLASMTWLKVGGAADILFSPEDEEDLGNFLKDQRNPIQLVMGAGSNLLIRDGGISGTVVKLGRGFREFSIEGSEIEVGAALPDRIISERCQQAGISGFEFLYTIPGALGGGLRMNAGCYGGEIADRLIWARVMDPQGTIHHLSPQEMGYKYRGCGIPQGWIFLKARLRGSHGDVTSIARTMAQFAQQREATQPLYVKTGGSTFANPPGYKAWQLIDQAGFRGKFLNEAQFSPLHCNFLINHGKASAKDLEDLGEAAKAAVFQQTGIHLSWEIIRCGDPSAESALRE